MQTESDKRARLTDAATELIYRQGYAHTTLAEIASAAKVALGSVYYYFKTKDDVARAIVERRQAEIDALFERIDQMEHPRKRLLALVDVWVQTRDNDARYGCPIGSLCYELSKGRGPLSDEAAGPFRMLLGWSEAQFRSLGKNERQAAAHALHLVSALQGISLIANALGEADTILTEAKFLGDWLRTV